MRLRAKSNMVSDSLHIADVIRAEKTFSIFFFFVNFNVDPPLKSEVFYALSGLNPRKAYGPDGVPPIVLKNCASVLTPCLVKLFRLCLSTSTFPSC